MTNTPLFTAAITCFNRAATVRLAIESALSQDFDDYDLLIVDDASTDGSADVIREYAERAAVVIREQNGGEMAARNAAMAAARGDYVCFLDSDDVWFTWTLATFAEAIHRHNRPTVVIGKLLSFRDEAELNNIGRDLYADSNSSCYFTSDCYQGVMSAAIRRTSIEQAGGFVDRRLNCLDSDLMFRIGDLPGLVKIEAPLTLGFRDHDGIMSNTAMSYGGAMHLIESEGAGKYPGGAAMRRDRMRHITVRTRSLSMQCARQRQWKLAFDLYWKTIRWNIRLCRWGYILVLPLLIACPPLLTLQKRFSQWKRSRQTDRDARLHQR